MYTRRWIWREKNYNNIHDIINIIIFHYLIRSLFFGVVVCFYFDFNLYFAVFLEHLWTSTKFLWLLFYVAGISLFRPKKKLDAHTQAQKHSSNEQATIYVLIVSTRINVCLHRTHCIIICHKRQWYLHTRNPPKYPIKLRMRMRIRIWHG